MAECCARSTSANLQDHPLITAATLDNGSCDITGSQTPRRGGNRSTGGHGSHVDRHSCQIRGVTHAKTVRSAGWARSPTLVSCEPGLAVFAIDQAGIVFGDAISVVGTSGSAST